MTNQNNQSQPKSSLGIILKGLFYTLITIAILGLFCIGPLAKYAPTCGKQQADKLFTKILSKAQTTNINEPVVITYRNNTVSWQPVSKVYNLHWNQSQNILSLSNVSSVDLSSLKDNYTASNGIKLENYNFSIDSPTCADNQYLSWDGTAFTCKILPIAQAQTNTDQTLTWNISNYRLSISNGNTVDLSNLHDIYTAGDGLNLANNQFSINAPICNNNEKLLWNGTQFICSNDQGSNPLAGLSCSNGQVIKWDGSNWVCADDNVDDADANPANELNNTLSFDTNTNILSLNDAGGTLNVDLSSLADNTDNQTLTWDATNDRLSISNGNNVDMSDLTQTLTLTGTQLTISSGNSVNFTNWDTDVTDDVQQLNDLNDVTINSPTNKQVLVYNGSNWVNQALNFIDLADTPSNYGTSGYLIQTDGAGNLQYVNPSSIDAGYWQRTGTTLSPRNAGDDVVLNTGETLSITDFSEGGIVFADDDSGLLTQDHANLYWESGSHSLGIRTDDPLAALDIENDGMIIARGQVNSGQTLPVSGAMTAMLWYPRKAAFRAGQVENHEWDDSNIGLYSVAFGHNAQAKGQSSFAVGDQATANNNHSVAIGYLSQALEDYALAIGEESVASGIDSLAFGNEAQATAQSATAVGELSQAFGHESSAFGHDSQALGNESLALGDGTGATKDQTVAVGASASATQERSLSVGYNATAIAPNAISIGYYSLIQPGGDFSIAIGDEAEINSTQSIAIGNGANVYDADSGIAIGTEVSVESDDAIAIGRENFVDADGSQSVSIGTDLYNNNAYAYLLGVGVSTTTDYTTIIGSYNEEIGSGAHGWNANDPLFIIGNGPDDSNRSNALVVLKNSYTGIGTNNPTHELQVGEAGDGTDAVANAWNTFSDKRFKTNIHTINNALDIVDQLNGVYYDWKNTHKHSVGFIAQEVKPVLPSIVAQDEKGYLSLDYSKLTPILTNAIKELHTQTTTNTQGIENIDNVLNSIPQDKLQILETHINITDTILTFLKQIIFKAKVTFQSVVVFMKRVTFNSLTIFRGKIRIANKDTAGYAIIPAGQDSVSIKFNNRFKTIPLIILSPENKPADLGYKITHKTRTGFKIELINPATVDVKFTWVAVEAPNAPIVTPSTPNTTPTATPSPTPTTTITPTTTPTITPTTTPEPTATPTPTPTNTPTSTPTVTPTTTPTETPTTSPTP